CWWASPRSRASRARTSTSSGSPSTVCATARTGDRQRSSPSGDAAPPARQARGSDTPPNRRAGAGRAAHARVGGGAAAAGGREPWLAPGRDRARGVVRLVVRAGVPAGVLPPDVVAERVRDLVGRARDGLDRARQRRRRPRARSL